MYKETDGTVYKFSAVCPHMKAIVRYNASEKTFDCPFHGSRFDRYGKVRRIRIFLFMNILYICLF